MKPGLCVANSEGYIIDVDHRFCDLLGFDRTVFVDRHPLDLTHPADRPRNAIALENLAANDEPFVIRKRYMLPGGREQWVENCVRVIREGGTLRRLAEMRPTYPLALSTRNLQRGDAIFSALERLTLDIQMGPS